MNRKSVPQGPFGRPRVSKKRPGGARLDLLVFYSVFKRPQSTGGIRRGAVITYRLGRLTELNNIQTSTSLHILENQPCSYTHWRAGGHGADLKAKASCRRPQNIEKCKNMKNVKNENCQKLIIFEGFRQNGLQIRIQRNFLRISTPVKIDFRHFFENDIFLT